MLKNSAIVIVPSWNCEAWIEKCLLSITNQTYSDIGVIFIDDVSVDHTEEVARRILDGRRDVVILINKQRSFALKNIITAVREHCANPESVIFTVDGDDWLDCSTAIEEMMEQHQTHDVVWSKYRRTDNGSEIVSGHLTHNNIRNHPWVSSHLRSFKKFLFDAVKDGDFRDEDGNYYYAVYDLAIMLPILEMTPPERRLFYDKCFYVYNRDNPVNEDKGDHCPLLRIAKRIRSCPAYSVHPKYAVQKQYGVSVIMSTFCRNHSGRDCPNLLRRALDSILTQTFKDWELVLIDDGSRDGTAEVCREYAERDTRIRLVRHEDNSGQPSIRYNEGMLLSRGDYFMFMFDDDMWHPNAIADLYLAITGDKKDCGMVYGGAVRVDLDDNFEYVYKNPWNYERMMSENIILNLSVIVKRSVINDVGGYDEDKTLRRICDWELWVRISRKYRVDLIDSMVGVVFHGYSDGLAKAGLVPYEAFRIVKRDKKRKIRLQGELVGGDSPPKMESLCSRDHLDRIEFDEDAYLKSNPDVQNAILAGRIGSGWEHYILYGCREKGCRGVTKELNEIVLRVINTMCSTVSGKK